MRIKEYTIMFTSACGLDCRYCCLQESLKKGRVVPDQEIFDEIEAIDKESVDENVKKQLLFTGGEPFLFKPLIKEIIEKYGDRFWYKFNTSGYLLTEDYIRFLAKYHVSFVLSVDGDERLTNYLRPMRNTPYHTGYMKELKKILPTLLFYFPSTPFRIIVSPRYVDCLHKMYLFAEQSGFRFFSFVLDIRSRPSSPKGIEPWNDNDTIVLTKQLCLIADEIVAGFREGLIRPTINEVSNILFYLANGISNEFDPHRLPCQILEGRQNYHPTLSKDQASWCMKKHFESIEDFEKQIKNEFLDTKGKCPLDPNCPAFFYCANSCCPKDAYDAHGRFFEFEELGCALRKACYITALYLLEEGNKLENAPLYAEYLQRLGFGGN